MDVMAQVSLEELAKNKLAISRDSHTDEKARVTQSCRMQCSYMTQRLANS